MEEIKVKNFGKAKVFLPLPYLLALQKESWQRFWEKDLRELFSEISPIRDYTGKELELWFLDYKLDEPKYKTDWEAKHLTAGAKKVIISAPKIKEWVSSPGAEIITFFAPAVRCFFAPS